MDNVFRGQRFSVELFSEPSDEENKSRKFLNEENMSILYEEPCYNLFIINISFFIWKSSYNVKGNEKSLLIRRIRGIYDTSFMFSIMVLVLNRIFAIVKINSAVMIVIIRRFRRSPFLVVKIEGWILHSFIIWQNDPWLWMALLRMHRIFIYSINSISSSLLFLVPTIIRIETCFRIMASDTNNFWL